MRKTVSHTTTFLLGAMLCLFAACSSKTESTTTAPANNEKAAPEPAPAASSQPDYNKATGTFVMRRNDAGGELTAELRFQYMANADSPYALTLSRGNSESTVHGVLILQNDEVFVTSGSEDSDPNCELSLVFSNDNFQVNHSGNEVTCGGKKEDLRGTYTRTSSAAPSFN